MSNSNQKGYYPATSKIEDNSIPMEHIEPMESIDLSRKETYASYLHDDELALSTSQLPPGSNPTHYSSTNPFQTTPSNIYVEPSQSLGKTLSNDHNSLHSSSSNPTYCSSQPYNPYAFESQNSFNTQPPNLNNPSLFDQQTYNPEVQSHPSQRSANHVQLNQYPGFRTDQLNESSSNKPKKLHSVPEESSDSDSSDDEDLVDLSKVVNTLKTKNLSKELNKESLNNNSSDANTLNDDYKYNHKNSHGDGAALLSNDGSPGGGGNNSESNSRSLKRRGFRRRTTTQNKKKKESSDTKSTAFFRKVFVRIYHMSLAFRCIIFWFPLAAVLFIPLAIGAWVDKSAEIGQVPLKWFFIWLEVVWGAVFVSVFVAHLLPALFYFITSIIAPSLKKYRSVITAMEIPISFVFSSLIAVSTFMPVMTWKKNASEKDANFNWQKVVQNILVAILISSLVYCSERFMIHLISVSFHKKRFAIRIKENKKSIVVLSELLYAACTVFPPSCPEFMEEDLQLQSGKLYHNMASGKNGISKILAKNKNVQRIFGKFNHAVDMAANNLKHQSQSQPAVVMESVNDLKIWCNNVVTDSMSSKSLAQVLAVRIWMSLVLENENALTMDDLIDVLGAENKEDYEALFQILDQDGNGNLTLEEMKSATRDIARERKSIYKSLKDVDTAIAKLHSVLVFIVFIIIVIVFIGMLAPSVTAVLATLGTTILGLSFIFSTTCQEICASCVFLFVKHPIDVGDRVNILNVAYFVREISLLSTVFTRISDNSVVQAPNSILNTLWIDNFSRSGPQCFNMDLTLGLPETSFEQLQEFNNMLDEFCLNNSRDYAPTPFFYVTSYPDLDRVKVTVIVTFRSNFADGMLYSKRRNKLLRFLGRCINELSIHVPRREDQSTDPGLPSYYHSLHKADKPSSSVQNSDLIPFVDETNREFTATGKRTISGFPQVPVEYMDTIGSRRARMGFAPEKPLELEQAEEVEYPEKEGEEDDSENVFSDDKAVEKLESELDNTDQQQQHTEQLPAYIRKHKPSIIPEEDESEQSSDTKADSKHPSTSVTQGVNEFNDLSSISFPSPVAGINTGLNIDTSSAPSKQPQIIQPPSATSIVPKKLTRVNTDSAVVSGARLTTTTPTSRVGRTGTVSTVGGRTTTVGRHDTVTSRRSGTSATTSNVGTGIAEDSATGRRRRGNSMTSNGNNSLANSNFNGNLNGNGGSFMSPINQRSVFSPELQLQLQNNPSIGLTKARSMRSQKEMPVSTDGNIH